jgi:SAM-dependent methyltransferase
MPSPSIRDLSARLLDSDQSAGLADPHYFYQDLWAARLVYRARPQHHFDVGSRIDGFISAVLVFMDVTMLDIRPLPAPPTGLRFRQADAAALPLESSSVTSISTLHAVEHFGLGRYGDPIDPVAHFKAMDETARVLAPQGRLYFSVPIGRERVMFNAQRVLSPSTVLNRFDSLRLVSFSVVDDAGRFVEAANPSDFGQADYACGLFEFTKDA